MRDNDYFYKMRMHYELEIDGQHQRYNNYVQASSAADHHRNVEMVRDMLKQIVKCTFLFVDRRRMLEARVENEVQRSITAVFVNKSKTNTSSENLGAAAIRSLSEKHNPSTLCSFKISSELEQLDQLRQGLPMEGVGEIASDAIVGIDALLNAINGTEGGDSETIPLSTIAKRDEELVACVTGLLRLESMPEGGITCDELAEIFYLSAAFNALASSSEDGSSEFSATDVVKLFAQLPDEYPSPLLEGPWLEVALGNLNDAVEVSEVENTDESDATSTDFDSIRVKMGLENFIVTYVSKSRESMYSSNLLAWRSADLPTVPGWEDIIISEVDEYIHGEGNVWCFSKETDTLPVIDSKNIDPADEVTESSIGDKLLFGNTIKSLRTVVHGPPSPQPSPDVPRMDIQIALIGKPFSGKSNQAKRIAERFNLAVIDAKELLSEAMQWSSTSENTEVMQLEGEMRIVDDRWYHEAVSAIGAQVKESLLSGAVVPDSCMVDLIVQRIKLIKAEADAMRELALTDARATTSDIVLSADELLANAGYDDSNGTGISGEERRIALLRMLFDSWDGDKSGEVDVGEMVTAVRAFGEGQSEEAAREEAMQVVQQMDADQDGSITWDEFVRFFTALFSEIREEVFDEVIATVIATTKAQPYRGWVLDGFPTTSSQAKMLEEALSGFVEPLQASSTFSKDLRSALAPCSPDPPIDAQAFYGCSALDLVLEIKISNDEVLRRALGRRYDPILNKTFHIETNPPSMEEAVKIRLQEPADMATWRATLVAELCQRDADLPEVEDWYRKFNNKVVVSPFLPFGGAALGEDALFESMCGPVHKLVKKQKDAVDAEAAAAHLELKKRNLESLFVTIGNVLRPSSSKISDSNEGQHEPDDDVTATTSLPEQIEDTEAQTTEALLPNAEDIRSVLRYVRDTLVSVSDKLRESNDDDSALTLIAAMDLSVKMTPKEVVKMSDSFHQALEHVDSNENSPLGSKHDDQNQVSPTQFADTVLRICDSGNIKGHGLANIMGLLKNSAGKVKTSTEYKVRQMYNRWTRGPETLAEDGALSMDHVTCTITTGMQRVLMQTYKKKAQMQRDEKVAELRTAAIQAMQEAEDGEPAAAPPSKVSKSGSKKAAVEEDENSLLDEIDIGPLPPLPLIFDLGELEPPVEAEEEDNGKSKKGKKGKGKGGDDSGVPTIVMPSDEEMGEHVAKEDFVSLVAHSYFGVYRSEEQNEIEMSLSLMNELVSEFVELARASAPPPPEPEPPVPRDVPTPPKPSVSLLCDNVARPIASQIVSTWDATVEDYIENLKCCFNELAQLRATRAGHYSQTRQNVHAYIQRASGAHTAVIQLQESINAIPMDMRYHADVKSELHQRVADTVKSISKIIEDRENEGLEDIGSLRSNGYVDHHINLIVQVYAAIMQAEVDRFHSTRRILVDALVASQGGGAGAKLPDAKEGELISADDDRLFPAIPPVFLASLLESNEEDIEDPKAKKGKGKGKGKGKKNAPEEESDTSDASSPTSALETMVSAIEKYLSDSQSAEIYRRAMAVSDLQTERELALSEVADAAAGGKGKDKKTSSTPEANVDEDPKDEKLDDLERALAHESSSLKVRLARLLKVCGSVVSDLKDYDQVYFDALKKRLEMRISEERSNLVSLSEYILSQIEAEEPLRLLTGIMDTDLSVVRRQFKIQNLPLGPSASGPPEVSLSGPKGTAFFVDRSVGMVKPEDPPLPPAIEKFSDAALAPSQADKIWSEFKKYSAQIAQEHRKLGVGETMELLQGLGGSGDLPLQWSSLSHEDLRAFVSKFIDDAELRTVDWNKLISSFPVAGSEEHAAALRMQNITRQRRAKERVEEQRALKAAEAKFEELDGKGNSNGYLDGDEIAELAEWVWESFHPGGKPIDETKRAELSAKLAKRVADSPNGQISFDAFEKWFRKISEGIRKYEQFQKV